MIGQRNEIMKILLESGADTCTTIDRVPPLSIACLENNVESVRLLGEIGRGMKAGWGETTAT